MANYAAKVRIVLEATLTTQAETGEKALEKFIEIAPGLKRAKHEEEGYSSADRYLSTEEIKQITDNYTICWAKIEKCEIQGNDVPF